MKKYINRLRRRFIAFKFVYYFKLKWWLKNKCTKCGGKSLSIFHEEFCISCSNGTCNGFGQLSRISKIKA